MGGGTRASGASEEAVTAAAVFLAHVYDGPDVEPDMQDRHAARHALEAAHSPALGLDRSVNLREAVEALRSYPFGPGTDEMFLNGVVFAAGLLAEQFSSVPGKEGVEGEHRDG